MTPTNRDPHHDHSHAGGGHDQRAAHSHAGTGHDHHHHGAGHHHAPDTFGRAFAIGVSLNAAFIIAEIAAGLAADSVALLADAGHNVSDVLGLLAAWLAYALARRPPSARFTYGLGSSSILAALFNAILLMIVVGALSLEAIERFADPRPVEGGMVMVVAGLGVVVNGGTAWLFAAGRHGDINIKGAYLHMAGDALVSVAVLVSGGLILLTGRTWIDPAVSLAVNAFIIVATWSLLRDSLSMGLHAVPPGVPAPDVRRYLLGRSGVADLHDFHIWPMSTTETALSAHLVMPDGHPGDGFVHAVAGDLRERFRIGHVTIQIETSAARCPLAARCLAAKG